MSNTKSLRSRINKRSGRGTKKRTRRRGKGSRSRRVDEGRRPGLEERRAADALKDFRLMAESKTFRTYVEKHERASRWREELDAEDGILNDPRSVELEASIKEARLFIVPAEIAWDCHLQFLQEGLIEVEEKGDTFSYEGAIEHMRAFLDAYTAEDRREAHGRIMDWTRDSIIAELGGEEPRDEVQAMVAATRYVVSRCEKMGPVTMLPFPSCYFAIKPPYIPLNKSEMGFRHWLGVGKDTDYWRIFQESKFYTTGFWVDDAGRCFEQLRVVGRFEGNKIVPMPYIIEHRTPVGKRVPYGFPPFMAEQPEGVWSLPDALVPLTIQKLVDIVNAHCAVQLEEDDGDGGVKRKERKRAIKLPSLGRFSAEEKQRLDALRPKKARPEDYYPIEIRGAALHERTEGHKHGGRVATGWKLDHQVDVRRHWRVYHRKGEGKLTPKQRKTLKERGYTIYTNGQMVNIDGWVRILLEKRCLPTAAPRDGWLAVRCIVVDAHTRGPEEGPYIPAARILKDDPLSF